MGVNGLPKTVTRQRHGCDLNPGPSAPESSTLTTRLPSHPGERRDFVILCYSREGRFRIGSPTAEKLEGPHVGRMPIPFIFQLHHPPSPTIASPMFHPPPFLLFFSSTLRFMLTFHSDTLLGATNGLDLSDPNSGRVRTVQGLGGNRCL